MKLSWHRIYVPCIHSHARWSYRRRSQVCVVASLVCRAPLFPFVCWADTGRPYHVYWPGETCMVWWPLWMILVQWNAEAESAPVASAAQEVLLAWFDRACKDLFDDRIDTGRPYRHWSRRTFMIRSSLSACATTQSRSVSVTSKSYIAPNLHFFPC